MDEPARQIRFRCPWCRRKLTAPADRAGGGMQCDQCRSVLRVPTELEVRPPRWGVRVALGVLGVVAAACLVTFVVARRRPASRGVPGKPRGKALLRDVTPPVGARADLLALPAHELLRKVDEAKDDPALSLDLARALLARQEYATAAGLLHSRLHLLRSRPQETGRLCYQAARHIVSRWAKAGGGCAPWAYLWEFGIRAAGALVRVADELGVGPAGDEDELLRLIALHENDEAALDQGTLAFLARHPRSGWAPPVLFWRAAKLSENSRTRAQGAQLYHQLVSDHPSSPLAALALLKQGTFKRLLNDMPYSPYAPAAFALRHGLHCLTDPRRRDARTDAAARLVALQGILDRWPASVVAWQAEEVLFGTLLDICGSKWVGVTPAALEAFAKASPNAPAGRIARRMVEIAKERQTPSGVPRYTEAELRRHGIDPAQLRQWMQTGRVPTSLQRRAHYEEQTLRGRGYTAWPVMPEVAREVLGAAREPLWAPARLAELPAFARASIEAACDLRSIWTPAHRVEAAPAEGKRRILVGAEGAIYVRSPLRLERPVPLVFAAGQTHGARPYGAPYRPLTARLAPGAWRLPYRPVRWSLFPAFAASVCLSVKADYVQPIAPGDAIYIDVIVGGRGYRRRDEQAVYRTVAAIVRDLPWTRIRKRLDFCPPPSPRGSHALVVAVTAPNCFGRLLLDDLEVVYELPGRGQ